MLNRKNQYKLITLLLEIANSINKSRNSRLRRFNLTSRQADILSYIGSHSRCTITDIAIERGCVHQTVQQIVKRMLKKELLTIKKSSQDGRYQILTLSKNKGKKLFNLLQHQRNNTCKELLRGMDNESQKSFLSLSLQSLNNLQA